MATTVYPEIEQVNMKLAVADMAPLGWNTHNMPKTDVDAIGVYEGDVMTAQTIDGGGITVPKESCINRHIVIEVTSVATGGVFEIHGDKVDEATGTILVGEIENITIGAPGFYQSSGKWIAPAAGNVIIVASASESIVANIHTTSYYDAQNNDFGLSSVRASFTPSATTWSISFTIMHIKSDGSFVPAATYAFANTDTHPRAYNNQQGHVKKALTTAILGSQKEGLVLKVHNATGMNEAGVIFTMRALDPETDLPFVI